MTSDTSQSKNELRPHQASILDTEGSLAPPPDLTGRIKKINERYIAGGAFGDVYRCRYHGDPNPQEVAVKALRFIIDESPSCKSAKMLRRELGIWRRLSHNNIVPFLGVAYGFGMHNAMSLVTLWMPNGCLRTFLEVHEAKLNTIHRLQILLDISKGLDYLHKCTPSIVHGDLNPNNVLLDADYHARLADFGCASLAGKIPEVLAYLQRSTAQSGALRWIAPEQLLNSDESFRLSTKGDIYSFGCVALQVLSGQQPWSEVHFDTAIVALLMKGQKPRKPESRTMADSHWDFIQLCWSSPQDRPASDDLVISLEQFIKHYPSSGPLNELFILSSVPAQQPTSLPENIASVARNTSENHLPTTDNRHPISPKPSIVTPSLPQSASEHPLKQIEPASPKGDGLLRDDSRKKIVKPIEISVRDGINSVAFLVDGKHFISGGDDGKINCWQMEDGKQVGTPMNAGSPIVDMAVSRNGQLMASGTKTGYVALWNPLGHVKLKEIKAHKECVYAVDISPDGTKIATGSSDKTVRVWSTSTGKMLLGSWKHGSWVVGVRFSPDGRFIATATADRSLIRIYDSEKGKNLGEFRVQVGLGHNKSLAWASDNKRLFVVSHDRNIHCLDVSTFRTLLSWPIHRDGGAPLCIALTNNDAFVVTTSTTSLSVWDATTRQLIGSVARQSNSIWSMAVSQNHDFLTGGEQKINVRNLYNTIPPIVRPPEPIFRPASFEECKKKHFVDHLNGRYHEAFQSFMMMLEFIENSLDPAIREYRNQYIDPTSEIQTVIKQTLSDIPPVLINTHTGQRCDRSHQIAAFEAHPIYDELRSSMTTIDHLDHKRIQEEVERFYQYAMFSHKWQPPQEPTFEMLEHSSIDELPISPQNDKLRGFRDVVRSWRLMWLWSDTCCINQADKGVVQESVVAMFRWYRQSALTVVHLLGVWSDSEEDLLWKSIWNTRGWTYPEYVASPVVQFYTEDWKPYRGLTMSNHKQSRLIRSEMERATRVTTQELTALEPGLDHAREKLYLASRRETARGEDIAYCLFGIFGVSISVIYGEGKEVAVFRLLQHILTNSDNVTLLSWMGKAGGGNSSYFPADLSVYDQVAPLHIRHIRWEDIPDKDKELTQSSSFDTSLAVDLYNRLFGLPRLSLDAGRLKLPGLVFPLTNHSRFWERDSTSFLYRAMIPILGEVQIRTKDDLTGMTGLLLIHPWISPLIDEDFLDANPLYDLEPRALRLVVRLRQPFGPLLLARKERFLYKRVATDSLIEARIPKETSLKELIDRIQTVNMQ